MVLPAREDHPFVCGGWSRGSSQSSSHLDQRGSEHLADDGERQHLHRGADDDPGLRRDERLGLAALDGDDHRAHAGLGVDHERRLLLDLLVHLGADVARVEDGDVDVELGLADELAAQALAVLDAWGISEDDPRVNPVGSGISLGHPVGATGVILLTKLAYALRHQNKRYGLVTMCIGGGQGIAMIIENGAK